MENRNERLTDITNIMVEFYDVDSMNIVWHGNYVKYFELARCHFLEKIGYTYDDMKKDGYGYPVIKMNLKYISPCHFRDELEIKSTLIEYNTILQIDYVIFNKTTNKVATKATISHACVSNESGRTEYSLNKRFIEKIEAYIK